MPRAQTNDLSVVGESIIRPVARAQNRWYNARPPRANRVNIKGFAQGLAGGLRILEGVEADEGLQKGDKLALEDQAAEAAAGSDSNALAAARLVAKGRMDEMENPYVLTGYARTTAQSLASRWAGTAEAEIRQAFAQTPSSTATELGIPPETPNAAEITKKHLDAMFGEAAEINPTVANDPWFLREFSKQRGAVERKMEKLGFLLTQDKIQQDNRDTKGVQLHGLLIRELGSDGGDPSEVSDFNKKSLVMGGIKDWKEFFANGVGQAYSTILNTQGAEAARDFVLRAGETTLGVGTLSSGKDTSSAYAALARKAEANIDREVRDAERNYVVRERQWQRSFQDSDTYRQILNAPNAAAAESMVNDLKAGILAGTANGVPQEFGNEAVSILLAGARNVGNRASSDNLARVSIALSDGDVAEARLIADAGGLSLTDRAKGLQAIESYEQNVEREFDRNPEVAFESRNLFKSAAAFGSLDTTGELQDANRKQARNLLRKHRSAIGKLPEEEREAYIVDVALPEIDALNTEFRKTYEVQKKESDQTIFGVQDTISKGHNATAKIKSLEREGKISTSEADRLRRGNLAVQEATTSALDPNTVMKLTANIGKEVTGSFIIDGDKESPYVELLDDKMVLTKEGKAILGATRAAITEQLTEQFAGDVLALKDFDGDPQSAAFLVSRLRDQFLTNAQNNALTLILNGASEEEIKNFNLLGAADVPLGLLYENVGQIKEARTEAAEEATEEAQAAAVEAATDTAAELADAPDTTIKALTADIDALANPDSKINPFQGNFFDLRGSENFTPFAVRPTDAMGPNGIKLAIAFPPHVTDEISRQMGGVVMKKNPIIDHYVNHRRVSNVNRNDTRGSGLEQWLRRNIAGPIDDAFKSTQGRLSQLRTDFAHPYSAQLEVVRRHNAGVKNAGAWETFARNQARDLTNKILERDDLNINQRVQAVVDTHSLIGLDYQGLISGRLESFGFDVYMDNVSPQLGALIPWQVMPLFQSKEDFVEARDEDIDRLYEFLGLDESQEAEFITAQKRALKRLGRLK